MTGNEILGVESDNSEGEMAKPDENLDNGCMAAIRRYNQTNRNRNREMFEDGDNLDWDILKKEFTLEKIWTNRSRSDIAKNFAIVLLFGLIPTLSDVVTDGLSVNSFLSGTVYTKHITDLSLMNMTNTHDCKHLSNVSNPFDPEAAECTHTGCFIRFTDEGPIIEYAVIECFEKDPVCGFVTLATIFLPGFVSPFLWTGCGFMTTGTLCFFLFPFFPLLLLGAKLVALINPGKHWKKFTFRLTAAEGNAESRAMLLLQLYIIFTRADRQPSTIRWATLATSLVMIIKTKTNHFLRDQPTDMTLKDQLQKAATLVPMILARNTSVIGSMAASTALLRYWSLLVIFPLVHIIRIILSRWAVNDKFWKPGSEPNPAKTLKKLITKKRNMKFFVSKETCTIISNLLILTGLTITANLHPEATIPSFSPSLHAVKFSDAAIVQNIYLLNYIYIIVMLSGAISLVLVYIQIVLPCKKHVKKTEDAEGDTLKYEENCDDGEESQVRAAETKEDLAGETTALKTRGKFNLCSQCK